MRGFVKLLIGLSLGALLTGCVVAPVGPGRAYVGVAAPAVVVRPYYYGHYGYDYGRRW